ncbi:NlpC/P60 family protein [Quadrisphaera granulorum]|uniref:NlpC/P60 family protein n=1 Tax=Quadrisphaera granulorum TaxID=317664 RepID=A0A316A6I7_9ACTN|nr:transglycosylase SLT domain-containing protein [Quadrisphaera granulorum]PWJ52590.1 NlpC/P60 family protein [Quadrisphaera granulorum]SZE97640.1 NlpC/P60 family protein [Quadrisphaera granulorum]
MSVPTVADPLADVQSRVLIVQQRIAALSGRPPVSALGSSGSLSGTGSTSSMFADALAQAQAQMSGTSGVSGDDIVTDATKYLGVPYKWGGTDPATGLDCSGFTQLVMRENGITLPRTAAQQAKVGTEVPSIDQAQPGDLIVLDGATHIGIYVGDGKMIHAPQTGDVVKISKVWETPLTIRRVTGGTADATANSSAIDGLSYLRSTALRAATGSTADSGTSAATATGQFGALFSAAEARYDLPQGLLASVAQVESGGNARAVSPAGARGLMQLMPGTAADLGVNAFDPAQAVDGAARLLSSHLDRYDGSVPLALAAYNAGPGNVAKHGGIPPFTETQNYVRKVTGLLNGSN